MHKLLQTTYKEILLLSRDIGGLVIVFVMPLILIITVTLIQDGSFKVIDATKIPILVVDLDQGELSAQIFKNFQENSIFEIVNTRDGIALTENSVQAAVLNGEYQMGIIIPANMSSDLKKKSRKTSVVF